MSQNFKLKLGKHYSKETRIVTLEELKQEFSKELENAIEVYTKHKQYKDMLSGKRTTGDYEEDFYSRANIRFNFNSNVRSVWYIDRIL